MDTKGTGTRLEYLSWDAARALHQLQLLSCDFAVFRRWESPDLMAPFWRLYWHDKAGAFIVLAGRRLAIPARRFVLVPPNTHFEAGNTAAFGQLFMHFLLEPGLCNPSPVRFFQLPADAALSRDAASLCRALRADSTQLGISLRAQALLASVLLAVPEGEWARPCSDARITEAIASIRAAYPLRLSNATLARKAALHPGAFIRLFRETTGQTPAAFLTQLRLEEACVLLHYSELSIDEVAEKSGFCERGHFSRVFSKRMGLPPARYRGLVNSDKRLRR